MLLFSFSTPDGLMRILDTIIRTLIVDVLSRQAEGSNGDVIGPEFIGCDRDNASLRNLARSTVASRSKSFMLRVHCYAWSISH